MAEQDYRKGRNSDEAGEERSAMTDTPALMKKIFGVIMVLIYFGMGALTLCGFFDVMLGSMIAIKWVLGFLFIFYGMWRAYRYFVMK